MVAPLAESLPEPSLRLQLRDELVRWAFERGASTTMELPAAAPVDSAAAPPQTATAATPARAPIPKSSLAFGADSPPLPVPLREASATAAASAVEGATWVRPVAKARQWLTQQDRAALRIHDATTTTETGLAPWGRHDEWWEQQWWQQGSLTPQAQQRLDRTACAIADHIPVEVLDFAEALEAFVVPPFLKVPTPAPVVDTAAPGGQLTLKGAPGVPLSGSMASAGPRMPATVFSSLNGYVSKVFSRLRGSGRGAQPALSRWNRGALVPTSPPRGLRPLWLLSLRPPSRVRFVPALPLLLCGGVMTRALTLMAALLAVLFSSTASATGGGSGDLYNSGRATQDSALAAAGNGP